MKSMLEYWKKRLERKKLELDEVIANIRMETNVINMSYERNISSMVVHLREVRTEIGMIEEFIAQLERNC